MSSKKQYISRGRPKNTGITSRALDKKEVKRLLAVTKAVKDHQSPHNQINLRNEALLYTGFHTCARISELCGLVVGDVVENGVISSSVVFRKTKSGKSRRVPLSKDLQNKLKTYLSTFWAGRTGQPLLNYPDEPLFPSNKGSHLHPTAGSQLVKSLLRDAGLEKAGGSHIMRKTGLTIMLNAGCSLEALRLISGHSSIAQLSTYLCATTNQVEAAVNQIKF
jgi:site-specific recombinase XerD